MSNNLATSNQSENLNYQRIDTNSNNNENNSNRRKHNRRAMQTNSQDSRHNHRSYQQQWYPNYEYQDDYYYGRSAPRGRYNNNNYYQYERQRRPTYRYPSSHNQTNQHVTTRSTNNSSVRASNESENLRTSIIEQLHKNTYECMICIIKIDRDQEIWSCGICYKMFHLTCIRPWANSEESGTDRNWRCPGCQYSYSTHPMYKCFCQKRINPVYQPGEIPHSCGERCGKKLNSKSNDCNHFCTELCHPGPCPTCTATLKRSCLCGRESCATMCSSNAIIRCENKCGKLKSCQHHSCDLICHPRECEPCDKLIKQTCSSHGTEREVLCSKETGSMDTYTCGELCGKLLSCGHHQCQKTCHDGPCPPCILLPENCKTCACGKVTMDNRQRKSCLDLLPTCENLCDKSLLCGPTNDHHHCSAQCHNEPCPPCNKESILSCRCGQLSKPMSCIEAIQYDSIKNPFCCDRRCNKKKICGKHRCTELCCNRDVHICEIICGKTLSCGVHECEELCHKNLCHQCRVNSYDELTCRCGRTILQPPIPCGTKPPACNYPCNRSHACDHPVYHNCHNENVCPPCTHLVSKTCVGEHTIRHNVPCHLNEVLCGQTCGKPLPCGIHTCQRSCHSGLCQSNDQKCTQRCVIKRRECGHSCNSPCHGYESCPSTICRETFKVRCSCGRLEKDVVCNVKSNESNEKNDDIEITKTLVQALSVQTIDLSFARKQKQPQQQQQQLECDDECKRIQRNKKLAQALQIESDDQRPIQIVYTDFLRDYGKKNIEFVQQIEQQFAQLIEDTQRHHVSKRCHSFKPMKTNERHVIHELATFYGLETQAMDPEPHRNVVAYASFGTCKIPSVTLSETIRREKLKIPPPVSLI